MKAVRISKEPVNISDWQLNTLDDFSGRLNDLVKTAAADAIQVALDQYSHISVPIEWTPTSDGNGGTPVSDPLTFDLHIGLTQKGEDVPMIYRFSLRDALSTPLEYCKDGFGNEQGLTLFSKELRRLADEIDGVIKDASMSP